MNKQPQESPQGVLNLGKCYLDAAEYLLKEIASQRFQLKFSHPLSLLIGHAIELILKTALLHWGIVPPMKHDLSLLRALAIKKGCALALDDVEQCHFDLLNEFFGKPPFEARYLKTGSRQSHDDAIILSIATRFAEETAKLLPGAVRDRTRRTQLRSLIRSIES